jgi:hypothetical protein
MYLILLGGKDVAFASPIDDLIVIHVWLSMAVSVIDPCMSLLLGSMH